jgi:rfaE bifunctional protein nucleotidyltransferase chain/domain
MQTESPENQNLPLFPSVRDIMSQNPSYDKRCITDLEALKKVVKNLQNAGYRVVLTQGVYDLIHEGHAKYLEEARKRGDVLIVAVDSDDITKARKGPNRPVVPETERLRMLTFLRSVTLVYLRSKDLHEKDPAYLHKAIRPDIFVTSKTTKDISEEDRKDMEQYVGKLVVLEPQASTSSTARIRFLMADGAEELSKQVSLAISTFIANMKSNE